MSGIASLLPFVLIIVVFWFLLIRPQQKRQRQVQQMQSSLSVGDRVVLTSGFFGEIVEITDDHVSVEIAEDVVVDVVRAAIGQVRPDDEYDEDAEGDFDEDENVDEYEDAEDEVDQDDQDDQREGQNDPAAAETLHETEKRLGIRKENE